MAGASNFDFIERQYPTCLTGAGEPAVVAEPDAGLCGIDHPATIYQMSKDVVPFSPPPAYIAPMLTAPQVAAFKSFFPVPSDEGILAARPTIPVHYFAKSARIMRTPPTQLKEYIPWLDRVQAAYEPIWRRQNIFHCIQLSRHLPLPDSRLIGAALLFWCRHTNSFHFPGGMMTPTLFDVAAITGLRPDGEVINPNLLPLNPVDLRSPPSAFSAFIGRFAGDDGTTVTYEEHVAFLTLWLSAFLLGNKAVTIMKQVIPLATLLADGHELALGQFLLANLYATLGDYVIQLRDSDKRPRAAGPMWLLHLWLCKVLPDRFQAILPSHVQPSVYGDVLCFSQLPGSGPDSATFYMYLCCFLELTFDKGFGPFGLFYQREIGPAWFVQEPASDDGEEFQAISNLWQHYVCRRLLIVGLPGTEDRKVEVYLPNQVARQLGFCQAIPAPFSADASRNSANAVLPSVADFDKSAKKNKAMAEDFFLPSFTPYPGVTQSFISWWTAYFSRYRLSAAGCRNRFVVEPPAAPTDAVPRATPSQRGGSQPRAPKKAPTKRKEAPSKEAPARKQPRETRERSPSPEIHRPTISVPELSEFQAEGSDSESTYCPPPPAPTTGRGKEVATSGRAFRPPPAVPSAGPLPGITIGASSAMAAPPAPTPARPPTQRPSAPAKASAPVSAPAPPARSARATPRVSRPAAPSRVEASAESTPVAQPSSARAADTVADVTPSVPPADETTEAAPPSAVEADNVNIEEAPIPEVGTVNEQPSAQEADNVNFEEASAPEAEIVNVEELAPEANIVNIEDASAPEADATAAADADAPLEVQENQVEAPDQAEGLAEPTFPEDDYMSDPAPASPRQTTGPSNAAAGTSWTFGDLSADGRRAVAEISREKFKANPNYLSHEYIGAVPAPLAEEPDEDADDLLEALAEPRTPTKELLVELHDYCRNQLEVVATEPDLQHHIEQAVDKLEPRAYELAPEDRFLLSQLRAVFLQLPGCQPPDVPMPKPEVAAEIRRQLREEAEYAAAAKKKALDAFTRARDREEQIRARMSVLYQEIGELHRALNTSRQHMELQRKAYHESSSRLADIKKRAQGVIQSASDAEVQEQLTKWRKLEDSWAVIGRLLPPEPGPVTSESPRF